MFYCDCAALCVIKNNNNNNTYSASAAGWHRALAAGGQPLSVSEWVSECCCVIVCLSVDLSVSK